MKTAIIHDWLVSYGGAERTLEALMELFPDAPVYTSVCDRSKLPGAFSKADIRTSFIQKLPFAKKRYRDYLPWMPVAFEQFDLKGYDLVISNSHACAKGVVTAPGTRHICYCLTPMRYAWDMYHEYMGIEKPGFIKRMLIPGIMNKLRIWDAVSANRVDDFIAISRLTRSRISKYYRRDSVVINPPVNTGRFRNERPAGDYYLAVSRLVPQKRTDIIVSAFNELGLPLKVIGTGRDIEKLKGMAKKNVEILGYQSEEALLDHMKGCKALVFASYEDFGIVPVEAQAAGRPVIVYGKGGGAETVIPGRTGVVFDEQTPGSIINAVKKAETMTFDRNEIAANASQYDKQVFKQKIGAFIDEKLILHKGR